MFKTAEFWVAVSFFIFVALLIWKKVPSMVTSALDARAEKIRSQLDDAQRLREEAQALLAEYERKKADAEKEAEGIVAQAQREAERFAEEARAKLEASMERRMQMAEDKITRAKEQAIKEVRSKASDLAISVATSLVTEKAQGAHGNKLIDNSIKLIKTSLN